MSRSSKPNWTARTTSQTGTWHVYDANGSGRAYTVTLAQGRVASAHNVTAGRKHAALDPNGPTAKMLLSVIKVGVHP